MATTWDNRGIVVQPDPTDPLNNLPTCTPRQLVDALEAALGKAIRENAKRDLAGTSYHVNFAIDVARELGARVRSSADVDIAPACRCDEVDDEQAVDGWPAAVACPIHDRPARAGTTELARAAYARDAP